MEEKLVKLRAFLVDLDQQLTCLSYTCSHCIQSRQERVHGIQKIALIRSTLHAVIDVDHECRRMYPGNERFPGFVVVQDPLYARREGILELVFEHRLDDIDLLLLKKNWSAFDDLFGM